MRFGYAPTQSDPTCGAMMRQAERAESHGFEALWVHEHHSQRMMYPDPLLALGILAGVTRRIALGTNMLLLPIHHPLRVAQAGAMVDARSNGRLWLGVAAGYAPSDLAAFGVSPTARRTRMEEGLALIRAVWTQERVDFDGEQTKLRGFELFPRPCQWPRPPIYMGALAKPAIRRAARLADGYVLSAGSTIEEVRDRAQLYHDAVRELSDDPSQRRPLVVNRVVHVVASRAERDAAAVRFARGFLSFYDRWGHADVVRLGSDDRVYEETVRRHFILGEPAECIEQIHAYREMGIGHMACLMSFANPPIEMVEKSLDLFGERILPAFPS
jgi:alkanesulfonate monooxygenase SsuD/methylene tetrahydromethanopterin reductase-like flavin-dependent oxidoreductase (luciferase family)